MHYLNYYKCVTKYQTIVHTHQLLSTSLYYLPSFMIVVNKLDLHKKKDALNKLPFTLNKYTFTNFIITSA